MRDRRNTMAASPSLFSPVRGIGTRRSLVGGRSLTYWCIAAILISVTFGQRFGVTMGGFQLQLSLFVALGALVLLVVTERARIRPVRVLAYAAAMVCMSLTVALTGGDVSVNSFLLLVVLYFGHVFAVPMDQATYRGYVNIFQTIMVVMAGCGVAQFFGQFVVYGDTLFTFDDTLPEASLIPGYNTVIPLYWGSALNKSNGFFFVEPSVYAQFLAVAIVTEVLLFRAGWRLVVYFLGLAVSYSGTGLLVTGLFLPIALLVRGNYRAMMLVAAMGLMALLFSDSLNLDTLTDRVGEFSATTSSGFARYIGPFWLIGDFLVPDMFHFLVGLGPGSIDEHYDLVTYAVHDPTWAKLFFEYGLFGFAAFVSFYSICVWRDAHSRVLGAMLFFTYFIPQSGLLLPFQVFLVLALAVLPTRLTQGRHRDGTRP